MKGRSKLLITVLGGWFGLHKYIDGKISVGILYTLTFGLFGIGWIYDSIKVLFSSNILAKDASTTIDINPSKKVHETTHAQISNDFKENLSTPDWHISVSFGKSTSNNYQKAVALAKMAPQYHEQMDDGKILHQAIYSSNPKEYLAFIMLYELVNSWKSTFVIINSHLIDRKIIGQLNYCYGDRCRSGNPRFCYGASYMTENPFGCHRLQISACNNPWWSFYVKKGNLWILDRQTLLDRINSAASIYCLCPVFNYEYIINELNNLPLQLTTLQYQNLIKKMQNNIYLQV